jgi:hypothetical protein
VRPPELEGRAVVIRDIEHEVQSVLGGRALGSLD